jgi:ABC-type transporter Mla subunit MlaD
MESAGIEGAPAVANQILAQLTNLTNAVHNINARLDNMDATLANHTQQLNNINATLANHTQQLNNINATLANHTQQLNQLNNRMEGVEQRLAELGAQQANATQSITLAVNTNAIRPCNGALVPFAFANNLVHPGFPRTSRDLLVMTGPDMTALLNANGIMEIPHDLEARRARVERLITTAL